MISLSRSLCLLTSALALLPGAVFLPAIAQSGSSPQIEAPQPSGGSVSEPAIAPANKPLRESGLTPATNPAISFRRPLSVSSVRIPTNWQYRQSEYLFTFDFPADAVEPLQKIVFKQIEGVGYPYYNTGDSYAFAVDGRVPLPISVSDDSDERTITVEFDQPVEPGGKITIALRARNPRDGIYIYKLAAYPAGATEGQYAGVERLNFYAPERRRFRLF